MLCAPEKICSRATASKTTMFDHVSKPVEKQSIKPFCRAIVSQCCPHYLIIPCISDKEKIKKSSSGLGFPGCIGSLECASRQWDACVIREREGEYICKDTQRRI